jgi:hypothetical protein
MLHDLAAFVELVLEQVLATVGSAGVLVLAAVAGKRLSWLGAAGAKAMPIRLFKINHGTVRIAIEITIGDEQAGRKLSQPKQEAPGTAVARPGDRPAFP